MITVSTFDDNGKITQTLVVFNKEEADLNGSWVDGVWFPDDHYVLNFEPMPRPNLGLPTTKQLTTNEEWVVGTLPEGTCVYIDGILVGETDETELVLSFPLAQTYSVRFDPPFPYKPHKMEVVVNEANT